MGKPYSVDLRERVVGALEDGMSTRQAAARFTAGQIDAILMSGATKTA